MNSIFDEEKRQESVCQVYTFLLIHSSGMNQNCFHHKIMYLYLQINSNSLKDLRFRDDSLYLKETWQNTCSFFLTKDNNAFLAWIKSNYVSHFEICHSGFLNLFGNMNFKPTF